VKPPNGVEGLKKCSDELLGSRRRIDEQSSCAGDRSGTVVFLYLILKLVVRVNVLDS
jgi:hypothetical protein